MDEGAVLDASALLALMQAEAGATRVWTAIVAGSAISAANFAEVVGKLID